MPKWPINGSLGLIEVKSSKSFFVWHVPELIWISGNHKAWRRSKKSHAYSNWPIKSWTQVPKWPINGSLGLIEAKSSKSLFVWHWFRNEQVAIWISTWCTPTKHQFGHKFEAAAKWSRPKFGPWTRRTRVGCYGLSGDFTASSLGLVRSILAR